MRKKNLRLCGPGFGTDSICGCVSCYLCDLGQITSSLILQFSSIKWRGAEGRREWGGSCITSKCGAKGRTWALDLEDLIRMPALDKCDLGLVPTSKTGITEPEAAELV